MRILFGTIFFMLTIGMEIQISEGQNFPINKPSTKTIIADLLMIDGDFYVVRGERGEIRIEVTPDTKVTETFQFGDRIKAVVKPGDYAVSIERAQPGEPTGIIVPKTSLAPVPPAELKEEKPSSLKSETPSSPDGPSREIRPTPMESAVRIIVADLLMVDGDFYVVRGEMGEIRIEVTPDTKLDEEFIFGDKIKARVLPNDRATWVVRAKPEEPVGIQIEETGPIPQASTPSKKGGQTDTTNLPKEKKEPASPPKSNIRTIVAEILMIDGDFYVVRGDRGEIRIEVTPETKPTEEFKFGDKIKAKVLPNDRAVSVERAKKSDPIGIIDSEQ